VYPLTIPGLAFAAAIGATFAVLTGSLLNGLAAAIPPLVMGLTWRKHEVPVFPFILGYQWVSIVIGHVYEQVFGVPVSSVYAPADVERTMIVSLIGLVVLALGMRLGAGATPASEQESDTATSMRQVRALFWLVMLLYLPDYIPSLNPRQYFGYGAMAEAVIGFRRLFVLALWYEVVRRGKPRSYLVVSFVWVLLPALGAYFATFKDPVFMLLLVVVSFWRPWEAAWWRSAAPRMAALAPVIFVVLILATAWQYGVKRETRQAHDRAAIGARVSDRASFFLDRTRNVLPELWASPQDGVDSLVGRLSYIVFFSRVLEYVPAVEPHADGELLWMAVTNGFMPRFIFPDKFELPSDSYYTNRFTGLRVASRETSISIGYMAEFYADWGMMGMYLSILGYGLWMGVIHRGVRRFVRPAVLMAPALVTVLLAMVEFEHQFIKGFAALNLGFAVVVLGTIALRPWLYRAMVDVPEPLADEGYPVQPLAENS
jgi:hypothetical protein